MSWSAFRTFTDPDAYHASFRDRQAESVITGRGDFRADSVTIQFDRLSLQGAKETLPRTTYCVVDPRQFAISFATDPLQQIYVSNGLELVPDAIVVFRAASEGHNRFVSALFLVDAKAGTNITYATTYASSGTPAMVYKLRLRVE